MEIEKTITDLMLEQHFLLRRLLANLEKNLGHDYKTIMNLFGEFKWEFEKHIFLEEKAVFKFFKPKKEKDYYQVVPELIKEHDALLEKLNDIENDIGGKGIKSISLDASGFKELMAKHKDFEEKKFYPNLEKYLDKSQKKEILKRIKNSFPSLADHY